MDFITEFETRGYFYQSTNIEELKNLMSRQKIAAYIGFDATAKSLHVGNLMQIMILRLLQQHGHKPIIVIGGGTTKVGDPSGKSELRKILTAEELQQNMLCIRASLEKFITFGNRESDAIMVNNADWLDAIKYIDFLGKYGRLFSINKMLTMDSVKTRLERQDSLTFLEFNYMLLQAYDFYHLHKTHNCMLQLGGSDQWGNIIMGVDLIRKITGKDCYGMTTPLLTTSSGAKMGKTAQGAVWLNADMLSPYDYFQYWRNVEDQDIIRFAKLYAEFDKDAFIQFETLAGQDINNAKKQLAYTLTKLCHGKDLADNALNTAIKLFEQNSIPDDMPAIILDKKILMQNLPAYELFFVTNLVNSKGEAKKLIRGGGAKINDQKLDNEQQIIDTKLAVNNVLKLSTGKKRHLKVSFE